MLESLKQRRKVKCRSAQEGERVCTVYSLLSSLAPLKVSLYLIRTTYKLYNTRFCPSTHRQTFYYTQLTPEHELSL